MAKRNTSDPVDLDYADYARWAASQGRAFSPIISAWQSVLGSIPTAGEIRGGYKRGFKTFSDMLGTMDFGAGGAGAGAATSALGTAIGAPAGATADWASVANAATTGDVVRGALTAGAYGATTAAQTQQLIDATTRKEQATLEQAKAKSSKMAAKPNPLEMASNWLSYLNARNNRSFSGASGGGGGGVVTENPVLPSGLTLDPTLANQYKGYFGGATYGGDWQAGALGPIIANSRLGEIIASRLPTGELRDTVTKAYSAIPPGYLTQGRG